MAVRLTTQDLVDQVRSAMDEWNEVSVDTERDILPALNRAQDMACSVLAKHYPDALITFKEVSGISTREYPVPEDAFEERVTKIDIRIQQSVYNEVTRVSYRDTTLLDNGNIVSPIPSYYAILNDNIRFYPQPNGTYPIRIWYVKEPKQLMLQQGTVTKINTAQRYIIVQDIGQDLSTEVDQLSSYVNFVDVQTGRIKGSCQLQSIDGDKLTFRATPARSRVLNQEITGVVPADLEADDLICPVPGTCVATLKRPLSNYLIQLTVAELRATKLGEDAGLAAKLMQDMEAQVKSTWAGREQTLRVKDVNGRWAPSYRINRYFRRG